MEQVRVVFLLFLISAVCSGAEELGEECPALLWVQFNSSCYAFIYPASKPSLNIESAHDLCKDIGGDIISINTQEENAFLLTMLQTKWKGSKKILLGMFYDTDDDSLKWFDKSAVTFSNWRQGQIFQGNLITCVTMDALTGLWDINDCDHVAVSSVLCKTLYTPGTTRKTVTISNFKMDRLLILFPFGEPMG
ncbi:CD302 antigen isoform X2 [Pseudophryne corroboree]|uniref:CD302 antigen isoform X2 n=1 Tax=Pseudophryne corroboree TaxID=495146 RepID=UPI003081EFBB